jgi:hypothetical protein
MTNPKNEISRFARNDGVYRRWWEEGGGEAAPFLPMTLNNECHFERSEKSRFKSPHKLNKFIFMQLFFYSSTYSGRILSQILGNRLLPK